MTFASANRVARLLTLVAPAVPLALACTSNEVAPASASRPGSSAPAADSGAEDSGMVPEPATRGVSGRVFYVDFRTGSDASPGTTRDRAWRLAPGMTGFAGTYTPQSGDTFVFKGGTTWTEGFPWKPIAGERDRPMVFTTDATWFDGGGFEPATFDNLGRGSAILEHDGAGYLHFDRLRFANCARANTFNQVACLSFRNAQAVHLTRNVFTTESWLAITFGFQGPPAVYEDYRWTNNDFSHCGSAIWFSSYQSPNTTMRNIVYRSNTFHDFSSQIGSEPDAADGVHGDGAWHGFTTPFDDATQVMESFEFCNNRFYGAMGRGYGTTGGTTALFFQQGALRNGLFCNNELGATDIDGTIQLSAGGNPKAENIAFYNNAFFGRLDGTALNVDGYKNVTAINNIVSSPRWVSWMENAARPDFVSDYNVLEWSAYVGYREQWYRTQDTHSVKDRNPRWVDALHGNFALLPDSPALNAGANLSSLGLAALARDITGKERPKAGAWNVGPRQ